MHKKEAYTVCCGVRFLLCFLLLTGAARLGHDCLVPHPSEQFQGETALQHRQANAGQRLFQTVPKGQQRRFFKGFADELHADGHAAFLSKAHRQGQARQTGQIQGRTILSRLKF